VERRDEAVLGEMESALTVLVRRVSEARLVGHLVERANVDLDRASFGALLEIGERGPLRLSDLAEGIEMDLSTVSRQVKQLETDGLVRRRGDPADGRAALIELTASGKRVVQRLRAAQREWLEEIVGTWSRADRQQFVALLTRFLANGGGTLRQVRPRAVASR
jgi:DNA-binding MarR family transcriptional regulator